MNWVQKEKGVAVSSFFVTHYLNLPLFLLLILQRRFILRQISASSEILYIVAYLIRVLQKNKITAHKKRLTMTAESEPVREPTDHRCERCGKVFAKAEELTNHYKGEHAE